MRLIDVDGATRPLPVYSVPSNGLLNDAGDSVIGLIIDAESTRLARTNAAGDVHQLGRCEGQPARVHVNPDGAATTGWTILIGDEDIAGFGAFRSSPAGFSTDFPGVPAGASIMPEALSADGASIAGRSLSTPVYFVWSEADGYTESASASNRSGTFMNADGSVEHGTRTSSEILAQRGVDTSGWEFGTPRKLSGDGKVLLGRGSCGGVPTLYRVEL